MFGMETASNTKCSASVIAFKYEFDYYISNTYSYILWVYIASVIKKLDGSIRYEYQCNVWLLLASPNVSNNLNFLFAEIYTLLSH